MKKLVELEKIYSCKNVSTLYNTDMKKLVLISIVFVLILGAGVYMMIDENHASSPRNNISAYTATPTLQNLQTQMKENGNTGIANPASVNCGKIGGTSVLMTKPDGSQYGLCQFQNDMICEEWALFREECPVGGVSTTGFTTIEQKYCVWSGGQTLADANAQCTFPNGKTCPVTEFYNGTCSPNE